MTRGEERMTSALSGVIGNPLDSDDATERVENDVFDVSSRAERKSRIDDLVDNSRGEDLGPLSRRILTSWPLGLFLRSPDCLAFNSLDDLVLKSGEFLIDVLLGEGFLNSPEHMLLSSRIEVLLLNRLMKPPVNSLGLVGVGIGISLAGALFILCLSRLSLAVLGGSKLTVLVLEPV